MRQLIRVQEKVTEVNSAISLIPQLVSSKNNSGKSSLKTLVSTYGSSADLPPVGELNSERYKNVLFVIDVSMMHDLTWAHNYLLQGANQKH